MRKQFKTVFGGVLLYTACFISWGVSVNTYRSKYEFTRMECFEQRLIVFSLRKHNGNDGIKIVFCGVRNAKTGKKVISNSSEYNKGTFVIRSHDCGNKNVDIEVSELTK